MVFCCGARLMSYLKKVLLKITETDWSGWK
jgi:hypothetical protein